MRNWRRIAGGGLAALGLLAARAGATAGGAAGGTSLVLGGSTRAQGLGGAGTAALTEPAALWVNPALLADLEAPQLSFTHGLWIADVAVEEVAVGGPTPLPGRLAGGLTVLRPGAIEGFDAGGASTGTFTPAESAVSVAWAYGQGQFAGGVAGTWVNSTLSTDTAARTFAGDAGVTVRPAPEFTVGAAVQHLGGTLSYGGAGAQLPLTIRGGAAWALPAAGLLLALDAVKPSDGDLSVRGGAEWTRRARPDLTVMARAGYATAGPRGSLGGLGAGAGVVWYRAVEPPSALDADEHRWDVSGVRLEYAWTPQGELGSAHWFGIALLF